MGKELYKDFFTMDELLCLQLIGYSNADISSSLFIGSKVYSGGARHCKRSCRRLRYGSASRLFGCRRKNHRLCWFRIRHHASEGKSSFTRRNNPMWRSDHFRTSIWCESHPASIDCQLSVTNRYVHGCDSCPMPNHQRNHEFRFLYARTLW